MALPEARETLSSLSKRLDEAKVYMGEDRLGARAAELEAQASEPDLWSDQERGRAVTSELGHVRDDLEVLSSLARSLQDAEVLLGLLAEEGESGEDEDLDRAIAELDARLSELELRSLLSGEYDERDCVAELHAGAGGTDAQDWCEILLRVYLRWAERYGYEVELDEVTEGTEAGLLSATFIVKGRFAYGMLSAERGVHRLVRMSPFDSQHRRHTSFASFDVIPFLPDLPDIEIDEKDLRVDTYRSSGAGGQHVNKTDSAVRLTHLPTGTVVSCQNERSQTQNKARAMQILVSKLASIQQAERRRQMDAISGPKSEVAWGSQIRSYTLAPFQLVKDHRTSHETGNVEAVLDGDITAFMDAELRRRRQDSAP